jgi:hypothetical protein
VVVGEVPVFDHLTSLVTLPRATALVELSRVEVIKLLPAVVADLPLMQIDDPRPIRMVRQAFLLFTMSHFVTFAGDVLVAPQGDHGVYLRCARRGKGGCCERKRQHGDGGKHQHKWIERADSKKEST